MFLLSLLYQLYLLYLPDVTSVTAAPDITGLFAEHAQVYLLLWCWYMLLLLLGLLNLCQRLLLLSPYFRYLFLRLRMLRHVSLRLSLFTSSTLRHFSSSSDEVQNVRDYLEKASIGDWFVLYQLGGNINKRLFFLFLVRLAETPTPGVSSALRRIRSKSGSEPDSEDDQPREANWANLLYVGKSCQPSVEETASQGEKRRKSSSPDIDVSVRSSPLFSHRHVCRTSRQVYRTKQAVGADLQSHTPVPGCGRTRANLGTRTHHK